MSLHPEPSEPVPEETARVARTAFPRGHPCLQVRDVLGSISTDEDVVDLFPRYGLSYRPVWRERWTRDACSGAGRNWPGDQARTRADAGCQTTIRQPYWAPGRDDVDVTVLLVLGLCVLGMLIIR